MWNERYSVEEYIYGTLPNSFLADNVKVLKSPILSLAEGEGRNAVFLASLGFEVLGVDSSEVALLKAQKLAKEKNVKIKTEVVDLEFFEPKDNQYNSIVSIFAHLPSSIRIKLYPLIENCLKPGGILLLEAYSENQINFNTGGPKDLDMLLTTDKIKCEFPNLEIVVLHEIQRNVVEGTYHTGLASVIQFIGRKK